MLHPSPQIKRRNASSREVVRFCVFSASFVGRAPVNKLLKQGHVKQFFDRENPKNKFQTLEVLFFLGLRTGKDTINLSTEKNFKIQILREFRLLFYLQIPETIKSKISRELRLLFLPLKILL